MTKKLTLEQKIDIKRSLMKVRAAVRYRMDGNCAVPVANENFVDELLGLCIDLEKAGILADIVNEITESIEG